MQRKGKVQDYSMSVIGKSMTKMDHSNKKPKFLDKFSGFIPNNLS
jgi:hypothetical protein